MKSVDFACRGPEIGLEAGASLAWRRGYYATELDWARAPVQTLFLACAEEIELNASLAKLFGSHGIYNATAPNTHQDGSIAG